MNSPKRSVELDNLRFVATIGVVLLHTSAGLVAQSGKISSDYLIIGQLFSSLTRFAVPSFLLISGGLLLSKELSFGDFFKKRFTRIVIPFLFYSILYLLFYQIIRLIYIHHNSVEGATRALTRMLEKGVSYHFWYVYLILGLYLFIPFLGRWIRNSSTKMQNIVMLLWFAMNIVGQLIPQKENVVDEIVRLLGYMGYLVLGYRLSKVEIRRVNWTRYVALALFLATYLLTFWSSSSFAATSNPIVKSLQSNLSPNIIIMSAAIFLFFRATTIENKVWNKWREEICRFSFGIYLLHVLVLKWLSMAHIHWNMTHPILAIPITTILTTVVSLAVVYGVSKLPFGKYISG